MMKLVDLNPEFGYVGDGVCWVAFDCFKCGPPCRVYLQFHDGAQRVGVWRCTSKIDASCLTLVPSFRYHSHGPRHPNCGLHATITDGEIKVDEG